MLLCVFILLGFVTSPAVTRVARNGVFSCSSEDSSYEGFRCHNGTGCIDPNRKCDGIKDCADASDEAFCIEAYIGRYVRSEERGMRRFKRQFACRRDELQCSDGSCIPFDGECATPDSASFIDPAICKLLQISSPRCAPPTTTTPRTRSRISQKKISQQQQSSYSVDPIPIKHQSVYNVDPIPPKQQSVYSVDPPPRKQQSVYRVDPIPPKQQSVYSVDPIPAKQQSVYSVDPIPAKQQSVYSVDPIPAKHQSVYSVDPPTQKQVSVYRPELSLKNQGQNAYGLDPLPLKHESAYSVGSPSKYQSQNAYSVNVPPVYGQNDYSAEPSTPEHQSQNDFNPEPSPPVYQVLTVNHLVGSKQPSFSSDPGTTEVETVKACVLPPYPEYGVYEVKNVPNAVPGQSFNSLALTVTCQPGYGVAEKDAEHHPTTTQHIYCINGTWSQTLPKCVPYCRLPPDPSVHYKCEAPGTHWSKTCGYYVAPGTSVNPVCNSPIYYSTETLLNMNCIDGTWDYVARCKADCGRVTPEGTPQVIGGAQAKRGELPWHAGIYLKTTTPYMQICGGSLIANNVVISAAHCFWKDGHKQQAASDYAVAVGKIYRPYNNEVDVYAQKSDIKEIKIPDLFQGSEANFQEDIAVLILVTPVVYKTYVRPVCLNFDTNFDRRQLQDGKLGKVAGWGLTAANGKTSQVLKVVDMPYINIDTCINTVPQTFREYITSDKICAGYTNGTAMCKGDSGGGLAFAAFTELNIERYYLRGVVSTAPNQEGKLCNDETYTTFTKVSKHADFIKESVASSISKKCPLLSFQCTDGTCLEPREECNGISDCKDGSDEFEELCGVQKPTTTLPPAPASHDHGAFSYGYQSGLDLDCGEISITNKSEEIGATAAEYGEVPWQVGIYKKTNTSYSKFSGGSLIYNNLVICGADRFRWLKNNDPLSLRQDFAVAAGKLYEAWDDERDVDVQKSDVKDVKLPKSGEDLAFVFLVDDFVYTAFVKPVCVLFNFNDNLEALQPGKLGKVAGWSRKTGAVEVLRMPLIENNVCQNTLPSALKRFVTETHICTAYTGPHFWPSDYSGSGLVVPAQDPHGETRHALVGIVSSSENCYKQYTDCAYEANSYIIFSNVSMLFSRLYLGYLEKGSGY